MRTNETSSPVVTIIRPDPSIWPLTPRDFWRWKATLFRLILREYQVRFKDTYLGYVWVILQPIIMSGILLICVPKKSQANFEIPFTHYLFSGLIMWFFIGNSFSHASISLIENRTIITHTNLKRVLIPTSIVISKIFDLIIAFLFLTAWIIFDPSVKLKITAPLVLFDILGVFVGIAGVGMFFSAVCAQFKDIRYIVPFLSQALFLGCPLFYIVPKEYMAWFTPLNPFSVFLLAVRDHLYGTNFVPFGYYAYGFLISAVYFALGALVFRNFEKSFADSI